MPIIKRCNINCKAKRQEVNSVKLQTQEIGASRTAKAVRIKKRSESELVVNGDSLKLLGVVAMGRKRYAIVSCNKGVLLLKVGDKVCEVLEVVDIGKNKVNLIAGPETYTLRVFSGHLRD